MNEKRHPQIVAWREQIKREEIIVKNLVKEYESKTLQEFFEELRDNATKTC